MEKDPVNPLAGVPGPGPYTVRNDQLNLGSIAYGEGQDTASINTAAPKAKTRGIADDKGGRPRTTLTPLFAPTERSNEDIMNGSDIGPGAGSKALMMQSQFAQRKLSDILAEMIPFDNTGEIAILHLEALSKGN